MDATVSEAELKKLARWLCRHWDDLDALGPRAPVDGLVEAMDLVSQKVAHAGLRKRLDQYDQVVEQSLKKAPRRR